MYKLKSIARRGTSFTAAIALVVGSIAPAVLTTTSAFADSLNPLTQRSLTLSSSSPGWEYTDGSGNALYAPPNSGANGKKTGNTFDFKVSTDTTGALGPIKTMSFQYCTGPAGNCTSPGDNGQSAGVRNSDSASTSDLNVVTSSPSELSTLSGYVDTSTGLVTTIPAATSTGNNFAVYYNNAGTWTLSSGWSMSAVNVEDGTIAAGTKTGANNYIILKNASGQGFTSGTEVKVVFFATNSNYITNPGSGAFFVKINTYNKEYVASGPSIGQVDITGLEPTSNANVIDGGVTVANVMNHSISIQTKVLETMAFSVGTIDPDTLDSSDGDATHQSTFEKAMGLGSGGDSNANLHGQCNPILTRMDGNVTSTDPVNVLSMGNESQEFSLSTDASYTTHSYFRLSSNSSAGATIYYSGNTLANTENDMIHPIGTSALPPSRGTEQFGLALDNHTIASQDNDPTHVSPSYGPQGTVGHDFAVDYSVERDGTKGIFEHGADNTTSGVHSSVATDMTTQGLSSVYHQPQLYPLLPHAEYDGGTGYVNNAATGLGTGYGSPDTKFAFDNNSTTIPAALASENSQVVDCVTGKVRYIANIAATTPAGIYTTKINYIAAPQY